MTLVLALFGGVAFLVLLGRYNESAALRGWENVLAPESTEIYDRVRESIDAQMLMVEMSYRGAAKERAAGAEEEARHLLRIGAHAVEMSSPSLLQLVRGVGSLARYASALAPIPPLPTSRFRSREMRGMVGVHLLIHHLLVTMRERLFFRLAVLSCGVRAIGRLLAANTERAVEDRENVPLARVGDLSADFGALGREAVASLRVVLVSLRSGVAAASEAAARVD